MGAERVKKQKLGEVEEQKNGTGPTNGEFVVSLEKLQEVQEELEKINDELSDEVLKVEQKYNEKRKPVYDKRSEVIKSIPDFWPTAFMSHPALGELLTEEDRKIFKYLSNLEVEDSKDVKSGYSITFHFKPNPYFDDSNLTKTFTFHEEGTIKVTATSIKWKEGMGISNRIAEEKKGSKRPHAEESFSFFTWFNDSEHKGEIDEIQDEVAELIKDDLWPNPFSYFAYDVEDDLEMCEEDDDDEEIDSDGSEGGEDEEETDDDDDK